MSKAAMASAVLGLIGWFATPAAATDMKRRPYTVNQPLNAYSWAGPYIGGNLGYAWGSVSNNANDVSGFAGGVQGGYNWQSGPVVYGLEADLQGSGASGTFAAYKFSNPWFGTVRGRIGYAIDNVLFYGTGGIAFGDVRGQLGALSESHASAGWTAGVGAEFGFAPNWSAKVEYLYVDLNDNRFGFTGVPNGYSFGLARIGVNYRF